MKKVVIIPLIFLVNVIFSQSFILEEGEVRFEYDSVHLSVHIPDSLIFDDEIKSKAMEFSGYFLYFLPPRFKLENRTLEKMIDLEELKFSFKNRDTIDYRIHYEYSPPYKTHTLSNENFNRNCVSADVKIAIGIELIEIPAQYKSKMVKVSRKDIEIGQKKVTIEYKYKKLIKDARVIVSRNFEKNLTDNLAFNKIVFLNGQYWSKFRPIVCSSPFSEIDILSIQKSLKDKGYNVEINGVLDKQTKISLSLFQKENKLPIGGFDVKTLSELGIEDNRVRRYENYLKN